MPESRSQLLTRKSDLLAALRLLEQDHEDGIVNSGAYQQAKKRYERETAQVLEQLDGMGEGDRIATTTKEVVASEKKSPKLVSSSIFVTAAALLVVGALAIFLISSLHSRASNAAAPTPSGTKAASQRVVAAERQVRAHTKSVADLITLGNAYLENGQPTSADATYQTAMQLDPAAAQPATLHAMIVGYAGKSLQALSLLHQVEKKHPSYSRAWLLDGVFSSRDTRHLNNAIHAWKRFLALNPRSVMSTQVRSWIAGAKNAQKKHR
jgi:cytochrome c-type biogenesis protein CcmH/NrfG